MTNLTLMRACLLLLALTIVGHAHDPGLSALDLRFEGARLKAQLTCAPSDVAALVPLDADNDGAVSQVEVNAGRAQLEALGRGALQVSIDGRELAPSAVTADYDVANSAVHFTLVYEEATGQQLNLRSLLLARLPLGHRQFVTVNNNAGAQMLDATHNGYTFDLAAIAPARQTFKGFLLLGIEHILTGYDHLAFLLALLLLGGTLREAIKIITAFTVAHSITLALAALDVINLPSSFVEPAIAASIVYVGVENLIYLRRGQEAVGRRWLLTFAFGLIHGFGFASVLRELGLGRGMQVVVPLVSFNLGVELGQLAIALLALPVIWKLRAQPRFALRVVPACSLLIALLGGYWLIERVLF